MATGNYCIQAQPATIENAPVAYKYTSEDYGTERCLRVYVRGVEVACFDPFHRTGVPVDAKRRKQAIERAVRAAITRHYA